jgi:hypothetical protein
VATARPILDLRGQRNGRLVVLAEAGKVDGCRHLALWLPWFVAVIVNVLAGGAVVLLLLDPDRLPLALGLLTVAVLFVCGTVPVRVWRKR